MLLSRTPYPARRHSLSLPPRPFTFKQVASAVITNSGGNGFLTFDLTGKSSTGSTGLECVAYTSPGTDCYIGFTTAATGNLVVSTMGDDSAQLSGGGATAASAADDFGTWARPANNGDNTRISQTSSITITLAIKRSGTWGNTATITLCGGTGTLVGTFWDLGFNGQSFQRVSAVADVAEYSESWARIDQPLNRAVLTTGSSGRRRSRKGGCGPLALGSGGGSGGGF
ncbi:MAG: hypothetical protein M9929_05820 [Burkholderiaceae bacterium]|nr:hypothetical protein [Burkholderiaceae bacterium]